MRDILNTVCRQKVRRFSRNGFAWNHENYVYFHIRMLVGFFRKVLAWKFCIFPCQNVHEHTVKQNCDALEMLIVFLIVSGAYCTWTIAHYTRADELSEKFNRAFCQQNADGSTPGFLARAVHSFNVRRCSQKHKRYARDADRDYDLNHAYCTRTRAYCTRNHAWSEQ